MENFKETFYLITTRINNIEYILKHDVGFDKDRINQLIEEKGNLIKQNNLLRTFIIDNKYKK